MLVKVTDLIRVSIPGTPRCCRGDGGSVRPSVRPSVRLSVM